jgi:hypothetical protein
MKDVQYVSAPSWKALVYNWQTNGGDKKLIFTTNDGGCWVGGRGRGGERTQKLRSGTENEGKG